MFLVRFRFCGSLGKMCVAVIIVVVWVKYGVAVIIVVVWVKCGVAVRIVVVWIKCGIAVLILVYCNNLLQLVNLLF